MSNLFLDTFCKFSLEISEKKIFEWSKEVSSENELETSEDMLMLNKTNILWTLWMLLWLTCY